MIMKNFWMSNSHFSLFRMIIHTHSMSFWKELHSNPRAPIAVKWQLLSDKGMDMGSKDIKWKNPLTKWLLSVRIDYINLLVLGTKSTSVRKNMEYLNVVQKYTGVRWEKNWAAIHKLSYLLYHMFFSIRPLPLTLLVSHASNWKTIFVLYIVSK